MSAVKFDGGKSPLDLLPDDALAEVAQVLGFGAKKYGRFNWASLTGFEYSRLTAAAKRHIAEFNKGVDFDSESGKYHLAHATCCLLFLLQQQIHKYGVDDRYDWKTRQSNDRRSIKAKQKRNNPNKSPRK